MTLPRYNKMQVFWRKWPPMQVLLAHYVGYKQPSSVEEEKGESLDELDEDSMQALVEMFGPLPVRNRQGELDE